MQLEGETVEIFLSYHQEDTGLLEGLKKHLSASLEQSGKITSWHDGKIVPGEERTQVINVHLNQAQIILLLVSAAFLSSEFHYEREIKRAMERHTAGETRVIPVILHSVDWRGLVFGRLQALPKNAKPVDKWKSIDDAFVDIVQGIRAAIEDLRRKRDEAPPALPSQNDSRVVYVAKDIQKELDTKALPSAPLPLPQNSLASEVAERISLPDNKASTEDRVISPSQTPSPGYNKTENGEFTLMQRVGNYRLIRRIGRGGFADVYLGEHIHLGRRAAIKVLHTQLTEEGVQKFCDEAKIISTLEHDNIVKVLEFGFAESDTPYLVMDFAPYGSLRYPKNTRLPQSTVVNYVKQVSSALQYVHGRGVIHQDIKPENMLEGHNNRILLSDFGIAVLEKSTPAQGSQDRTGTVAYMAPELFRLHDNMPLKASDQYALGVVVYEWLSGNTPFQESAAKKEYRQRFDHPAGIPEVSPEVQQVVMRALARKPEERYASVQDFADALEQAVSSSSGKKGEAFPSRDGQDGKPPVPNNSLQGGSPMNRYDEADRPTVPSKRRQLSSRRNVLLLVLLAALLIIGGVVGWSFNNMRLSQDRANATSTALAQQISATGTAQAQANATGTAQANATNTAVASATASAVPLVQITSPADGSTVPTTILVEGTASGIPQNEQLWLLVEVEGVAGYYPQTGPVVVAADGTWIVSNVTLGGPQDVGKHFVVYVALVDQNDKTATDDISTYFANGRRTGTYVPLQSPLPVGIKIIGHITVVRG